MALFKICHQERLDISYYTEIESKIKGAIDRIHNFTENCEFEEADNISLEIQLGLLEMYFLKSMQCHDLQSSYDSQAHSYKNIEDLYIEIKTKLRRKQLCNLENANEQPSVTTAITIPKFDGNKDSYKAFIDVINGKVQRSTEFSIAKKINPANLAYNEKEVTEELYKNIVQETYSHAVKVSKNISSSGHGAIITSVVLRLAQECNKNLLSYVYSLWNSGERETVEKYMPATFKMIFSDIVTVIDKKFGLALKMQESIDSDGDRLVWGDANDKTSFRVNWKLIPFWENNRVYFHLKNLSYSMFMKLEIKPDDIGDRRAFGSNDNGSGRHVWILEPVVIDNEVRFYIFNREFNQGLKLQLSADNVGDRMLWGHNGSVYGDAPRFAWAIYRSF